MPEIQPRPEAWTSDLGDLSVGLNRLGVDWEKQYRVSPLLVDELDLIGDAELYSTEFRLFGEQLAHVDDSSLPPLKIYLPLDAVIQGPGFWLV